MIGFSGATFCSTPAKTQEQMPKNLSPDPRFYQYVHNGNLITEDLEAGAMSFNGERVHKQHVNCARRLQHWAVYFDSCEANPYGLGYAHLLALDAQRKRQDLLQQDKKETEEQADTKESSDKKK